MGEIKSNYVTQLVLIISELLGKIVMNRKMSKDTEITVHFSIIYILFTTLHAHIFRIEKVLTYLVI